MSKNRILTVLLILLSFAVGFYVYPLVPDMMASHWGLDGEVNGYMSKFWGLFLLPILSVVLFILFLLIPQIDPLKANVAKFRKYFDGFILVFEFFFCYLYLLTIAWNLGVRFNMTLAMMPALGALFFYMGIMLEKAERNFFIGIRTPWTLSSDSVWKKTHKKGGQLFKAVGVITALGFLLPAYAFILMFAPIIFTSLCLMVYSYVEFQKEKNGKEK